MEKALTFNEVTLSPVTHENQIWIRSSDLARALGYSREELVSRLYQRNADEFTTDMTQVIEIPAEHQNGVPIPTRGNPTPPTRIFSPRGCHMIAMLSRTPIAKEFRRWVLDVLDRLAEEGATQPVTGCHHLPADAPLTPDQQCTLQALVKAKVEGLPAEQRKDRGLYPQIWSRFNNHFRLSSYKQLPQCRMSEAVTYLTQLDICQKALLQGEEPLPLYRNGYYYLPPINENHVAGPHEESFMELWKHWDGKAKIIKDLFAALIRDIDARRGDIFRRAISELGRNADTMFSTDSLTESLYFTQTQAKEDFDRAMHSLFVQMRMCTNLAVAMRM